MTHTINPFVTERHRQFIIGTILGGSSIIAPTGGKNCYLSMRNKDLDWLSYKALELEVLASDNPITIEKTHRWHSKCYPVFSEYRSLFYKNKKRYLHLETLERLQDVTLAIWFGECGKYQKNKVTINTNVWGIQGTKVIKKYFELLDYDSKIVKERNNFRVELDEHSSHSFLKIVVPMLPDFFLKRLS